MIDLTKPSILLEFTDYLRDVNKQLIEKHKVTDLEFLISSNHIFAVLTAYSLDEAIEDTASSASQFLVFEHLADADFSDLEEIH